MTELPYEIKPAAVRAAELEQVLDACERANLKHLQRIEQLEELCHDLFIALLYEKGYEGYMTTRMEELGLLNEPSENEQLLDQHFKDAEGKTPIEQLEALTEACRKQVD